MVKKEVIIIEQRFCTPEGLGESYGIIINGKPRFEYRNREEVKAFLEVFNGCQ